MYCYYSTQTLRAHPPIPLLLINMPMYIQRVCITEYRRRYLIYIVMGTGLKNDDGFIFAVGDTCTTAALQSNMSLLCLHLLPVPRESLHTCFHPHETPHPGPHYRCPGAATAHGTACNTSTIINTSATCQHHSDNLLTRRHN